MEAIKLNDIELRYFSELFSACDVESTNKVSGIKAAELFRASQLPPEVLQQVTELCGAKRLGHFGRNQFYVALKLIGAAQLGLPLKQEILHSGMDIPLPKFVRINDCGFDGQHWQQFEDEKQLLTTEDENSERHSSDDEYDVWAITEEQREYYINQFRLLQPDLKGLISGSVAKEFFEKSKLPVQELSKIWQLSDVNKDGALSLEEFFTAMHLVVLRRNNIDLPETLPQSLIPQIGKESESISFTNSVISNKVSGSPQKSPPEPTSPHSKEDPKILHPVALRVSPESQAISSDESDPNKIHPITDPIPYEPLQEQLKSPGKWPVGAASSSSSAPADAQGEFKLGPPPQAAIQRPIAKKHSVPGPGALPPPPQTGQVVSPTSDDASDGNFPFPASSFSGSSTAMSASYHMGMSISQGPKKEPPPPPPPRPKRNHARSSSLDLNRLASRNGSSFTGPPSLLGAPPAVPPRMSPSTSTPKKLIGQKSESDVGSTIAESANFANFNQFASAEAPPNEGEGDAPQLKTGAFEVYKRPASSNVMGASTVQLTQAAKGAESAIMKDDGVPLVDYNSNEEGTREKWPQQAPDVLPTTAQQTSKPRDKKELQMAIRNHRERNMVLSRLNCELNQELSEVMEERITLEIQLEHMKPYSN